MCSNFILRNNEGNKDFLKRLNLPADTGVIIMEYLKLITLNCGKQEKQPLKNDGLYAMS